ncbi:MAG: hypothetical protein Q8O25_11060 [Sulfurisoma sp.]|nr:hypothetical protein [Sulfurisoma sp.]
MSTASNKSFPSRIVNPVLVSIFLLSLCGCGAFHAPAIGGNTSSETPKSDLRVARVLANEGLEKLGQYRYEDASRIFNAGLKFSPDNAQLHFLNGLTYHLLYLRGDEAKRELAVTGYELALNYDPAHYYAALQLGRLEFEAKRYEKSAEAFRHSTDIETQRGDGYHGLAAAAYYARDLTGARAAIEKAAPLLPRNAEVMRAAAMIYAAAGDQAKARDAAARYAVLEHNPGARARLGARIDQWRSWHTALPAVQGDGDSADTIIAQLGPPPSPASGGSGGTQAATPSGAPLRAWFDCGGAGSNQPQSISSGSSSSIDDTVVLPSLPGPCQGAGNPRMLVLDIAFIRTENNASSSHGINLLEGLTYVFNRSRLVQDVLTQRTGSPDSREVTITETRSRGLPAYGIAYSLNIANATDSRTEMLANPSLVALDRMPSTFFAGSNVSLGIQGQGGGSSYVTDRPVGVSLSVTPTFVDGDSVLLAVRAARSFIEQVDQAVLFGGHTLQTSRNAVSANVVLKLGQTLILSGLSEQEIQRNSNGVPVLKDIPVLQYLFGTKTTQNFTRSVLVLITPRVPAYDREIMAGTIGHIDSLSGDKSIYRPLIEKTMKAKPDSAPGNLEGTYRHAFGNKLFLQFRSGDLAIQHWSEPSQLRGFFQDMKELLYF